MVLKSSPIYPQGQGMTKPSSDPRASIGFCRQINVLMSVAEGGLSSEDFLYLLS